MTLRTLIRRSLRYHWRAHLGVTLGAAIGSAALIGALVVGDSVRGSLLERALARVGTARYLLAGRDRFFSAATNTWSGAFGDSYALGLHLTGVISAREGTARANRVNLLGTHSDFWKFSPDLAAPATTNGGVMLNRALAARLGVVPGDTVFLRFQKPSALSADAPLVSKTDSSRSLRLAVQEILPLQAFGDFAPLAGSTPPLNAFIRMQQLQQVAGLEGRANLVLQAGVTAKLPSRIDEMRHWLYERLGKMGLRPPAWLLPSTQHEMLPEFGSRELDFMLSENWNITDLGLSFQTREQSKTVELRSSRIFLDPPIVHHVTRTDGLKFSLGRVTIPAGNERLILTYLANLLQAGTNATPYSMVTAAGPPWTPADLRDDEIVVGQWLADDLRVRPGDEIALSYFDPESGARLVERTNTFRVRGIVPMELPWADRTLMPDFPGIEKAESTHDWDAGFPLTYKIRQKDEDYWKQFRGTPKAFITLAAGQKMWGNRFGNLTAIRFPIPTNAISLWEGRATIEPPKSAEEYRLAIERSFLRLVRPEEIGLRFEPVREQALKAAEQSQDFGGLFLGFSFFLIAAALLLMAMLFQLGLEQRAPEIGTLLALGFTPKEVRKLLLGEGVALAFLGGGLGALGGLVYARAMLHGLATVWRGAVGATSLNFHVTGQTLVIGLFASMVVSAVTIWLTLRKFVRREPRELLAGEIEEVESKVQRSKSKVIALGALMAALALVGWMLARGDTANAGAFFGAGALVLIAGLGFASSWLANVLRISCPQNPLSSSTADPQKEFGLPAGRRQHVSLGSLGLRGCARRRKRSLATVAMLACGSFLIVSIGVFRLDANRDATQRSSGTGGFALIGETTMPVVQDLNSSSGRDFFALKEEDLKGVSFVPFRVREGDEASCLNLNRAQKPRLLGVKPELLERRFAFTKGDAWQSLKSQIANRKSEMAEVPAIGDANSIQWAMGKQVGDTLDYVDERGQPFKVRIGGAVANSILQGQLIIDEAEFVKRFPGESGYRQFLIDAPTNGVTEVSATLSRAMQDVGLELTPAAQRLAQFNAVQNTYLGTFQVLGGLGLLLGSVGLGIVVLRNVLERRGELAVLLAVGFRKPTLQRLLLIENGALLVLGLTLGAAAAAVAVLPALLSPGTQLPWLTLALTLAAVLSNGALWTWAATRVALRGDLLAALRNE